ncbi:MAG: ester cyclase [Chitinophagaceae bacterium]|nr:ester cyclase [Chitinophagaceae bacterium]
MKRVFFIATAGMLCLFTSCNDAGTTTTTTNSSENDKNLANNTRALKAIETGDKATIDSLVAGDAVDHQGANGMDLKGTDSVRLMLADMHNHVKDLKFDVVANAANGNYIFSLVHMTGTLTGAMWGRPAGAKLDEKNVDVIMVKDGKMTEHWGFVDPNEMMKQMPMPGMDKMDTTKKM